MLRLMLRRAALGLGIALLTTFVACEAWVYTHRTDAPPVDDADLASRWEPAPDAQNGHVQLAAAARELAWPEERAERLRKLASELRNGNPNARSAAKKKGVTPAKLQQAARKLEQAAAPNQEGNDSEVLIPSAPPGAACSRFGRR